MTCELTTESHGHGSHDFSWILEARRLFVLASVVLFGLLPTSLIEAWIHGEALTTIFGIVVGSFCGIQLAVILYEWLYGRFSGSQTRMTEAIPNNTRELGECHVVGTQLELARIARAATKRRARPSRYQADLSPMQVYVISAIAVFWTALVAGLGEIEWARISVWTIVFYVAMERILGRACFRLDSGKLYVERWSIFRCVDVQEFGLEGASITADFSAQELSIRRNASSITIDLREILSPHRFVSDVLIHAQRHCATGGSDAKARA